MYFSCGKFTKNIESFGVVLSTPLDDCWLFFWRAPCYSLYLFFVYQLQKRMPLLSLPENDRRKTDVSPIDATF